MTVTLSEKPTLVGTRALLRPVGIDDVEPLLAAMSDPETQRLTGSHPRPYDVDPETQRRAVEEWYRTRHEHADRLDLAIVDRDSGRCAGEVVLNELSVPDRSCNLRIMIGPEWTGRGLGTEAISLLLAHAFDTVGLHRISLGVYAFNPRAQRVYEKVGFRLEGTLRDALHWDGTYVDELVMAVLATDPRP
ncbi:GNAT family N-acetyltransferase [Actinocatenispora rupis]|uniref:Acetyltransferase n=1 Tax=Actinocatenispora rupis TaxID=519421 RepID=A0A8J3IX64_9ACTN|nr:GNAT family protein [Actinocatenispora rupis]GID11651.1 acetyltransferase [Actinocatenispora rupis]